MYLSDLSLGVVSFWKLLFFFVCLLSLKIWIVVCQLNMVDWVVFTGFSSSARWVAMIWSDEAEW